MIKDEVLKVAENKRLPCAKALALAKRLKVNHLEIGKVANELGIKITDCQLGCFGIKRVRKD